MVHIKGIGHVHSPGPGVDGQERCGAVLLGQLLENLGLRLGKCLGAGIGVPDVVRVPALEVLVPVAVQVHAPLVHSEAVVTAFHLGTGLGVAISNDHELGPIQDAARVHLGLAAYGLHKMKGRLRRDQLPSVLAEKHHKFVLGSGTLLGQLDHINVHPVLALRGQAHEPPAVLLQRLQLLVQVGGGMVERVGCSDPSTPGLGQKLPSSRDGEQERNEHNGTYGRGCSEEQKVRTGV
mmetsp:Transcript_43213/g.94109  ORF Transcript_43213/g.94109 Transcript_43213/m.94109 type:complete len:236 (-) Transcript_43213:21-728(-)